MQELPLFPLDTVLFPGAPIQLHIFEPRYRQMMRRCVEEEIDFGVVLIRQGSEALGPLAEPFEVGCRARIEQVQPLSGDRMRIEARGSGRFRIRQLRYERPYLVGMVEPLDMAEEPAEVIDLAARRLRPWVQRYAAILARVDRDAAPSGRLPADALAMAWTAAWLLQAPDWRKQELLASPRPTRLLGLLRRLYREELPLAERMREAGPVPMSGPFSIN